MSQNVQLQLPTFNNNTDLNLAPVRMEKRHVNTSTFKAGLSAQVHRWFRLTPSYGPELVSEMLDRLECRPTDIVLDPFAGAGTTLIECQLNNIQSIGCEVNPLLHFVGETSLNWWHEVDTLLSILDKIGKEHQCQLKTLTVDNLVSKGFPFPAIHNPYRWWRPDVLVQISSLLHSIRTICNNQDEASFFLLALAGVLVPDLTNVTLGRLQLHFINRDTDDINAWRSFEAHTRKMIDDLTRIPFCAPERRSTVMLMNSTTNQLSTLKSKVDCVVTSPPYPNRYSYVWNTRPHLYMLGYFKSASQASALDVNTIGGTWGTATSCLQKGVTQPHCSAVADTVGDIVNSIREEDNLMANYVMKYFNNLALHLENLEAITRDNTRLAYVVGCSRIKGRYIETDVLLGELIERMSLGYKINEIHRFRKRNSGKDLHEGIVYAAK